MIYKKDGKILVKDGKLCSSSCPFVCPASGIITLTFSLVNVCEGYEAGCEEDCCWPGAEGTLNTEFVLPYVMSVPTYTCFYLKQDYWDVLFRCLIGEETMELYACHQNEFCSQGRGTVFVAQGFGLDDSPVNNKYNIGSCGNLVEGIKDCSVFGAGVLMGYGGQASFIWTPE